MIMKAMMIILYLEILYDTSMTAYSDDSIFDSINY